MQSYIPRMRFCFQQTALSLLPLIGKRKMGYKGVFVYLSFWKLLSVICAVLNLKYHHKKEGKNTTCKYRDRYGEAQWCCYTYLKGLLASPSFHSFFFFFLPAANNYNLSETFAQGEASCGNLQVRSGLVSRKWTEFDSMFLRHSFVFQGEGCTSGTAGTQGVLQHRCFRLSSNGKGTIHLVISLSGHNWRPALLQSVSSTTCTFT